MIADKAFLKRFVIFAVAATLTFLSIYLSMLYVYERVLMRQEKIPFGLSDRYEEYYSSEGKGNPLREYAGSDDIRSVIVLSQYHDAHISVYDPNFDWLDRLASSDLMSYKVRYFSHRDYLENRKVGGLVSQDFEEGEPDSETAYLPYRIDDLEVEQIFVINPMNTTLDSLYEVPFITNLTAESSLGERVWVDGQDKKAVREIGKVLLSAGFTKVETASPSPLAIVVGGWLRHPYVLSIMSVSWLLELILIAAVFAVLYEERSFIRLSLLSGAALKSIYRQRLLPLVTMVLVVNLLGVALIMAFTQVFEFMRSVHLLVWTLFGVQTVFNILVINIVFLIYWFVEKRKVG